MFGKTVGVVGASRVGKAVLKLLKSFPVKVLLYDPFVDKKAAKLLGAAKCELDDVLRQSDVVTLHAPALDATRHILNARNIPLMRKNVLLVNTARGMLIDESALVEFLKANGEACAILDVTEPEPPAEDAPIRKLPNLILTPHIAGSTESGMTRIGMHVIDELDAFFSSGTLKEEVTREMLERIA